MRLVLDTSVWIEYLIGSEKGVVVKEHLKNEEIITPSIVLLELSYRAEKEKWNMQELLDFIKLNSKIVGFNDEFILRFGRVYNEAKSKVKDIGLADCIILTTALLNDAKILTRDRHFSNFKEATLI
jgi:predicted nucleic acid-binding protein